VNALLTVWREGQGRFQSWPPFLFHSFSFGGAKEKELLIRVPFLVFHTGNYFPTWDNGSILSFRGLG
jgi:hypothetical protein